MTKKLLAFLNTYGEIPVASGVPECYSLKTMSIELKFRVINLKIYSKYLYSSRMICFSLDLFIECKDLFSSHQANQ